MHVIHLSVQGPCLVGAAETGFTGDPASLARDNIYCDMQDFARFLKNKGFEGLVHLQAKGFSPGVVSGLPGGGFNHL